jgi:transmembrane sensor
MQQSDIDRLINRILAGEATPGEQEQLKQYFEQYSLSEASPEAEEALHYPSDLQSARMLKNALAAVPEKALVKRMIPVWVRSVAAVLIGLALLGSLTWYILGRRQPAASIMVAQRTVIDNPADSAKYIKLPDGTAIWLNSHAHIEWGTDSFAQHRNVYLRGEAYFEVAHDAAHPFTVHNGQLKTTVLGTTFNIKEDTAQHTVMVSLFTGKVALSATGGITKTLLPGEAAVYHEKGQQLDGLPVSLYALAWKTGQLSCVNEPLTNIIDYLDNYYKTNIRIGSSLKGLQFSGSVSLKEQLPVVLDRLLFVYGLHYKKAGDAIVIY